MDLLKILLDNAGSAGEIGKVAGVDSKATASVIEKLLPAISGGLQKNLQQSGGIDALAGALKSGSHERYLDNPASLADASAKADGNGILGHLLGGKDASRQLAAQVSGETGVDAGAIKNMLPLVAALAMGALSKKTDSGEKLQGGAGAMLGELLGGQGGDLGALSGLMKKFL